MSDRIEAVLGSVEVLATRLFAENWRPGLKACALSIECVDCAAEFVSCLSAFRSQMLKEHAEKKEVPE